MNYKNCEIKTNEWNETYLICSNDDGSVSYTPAVDDNATYAEYLRYTAWVEEGNDPDEFWATGIEGMN